MRQRRFDEISFEPRKMHAQGQTSSRRVHVAHTAETLTQILLAISAFLHNDLPIASLMGQSPFAELTLIQWYFVMCLYVFLVGRRDFPLLDDHEQGSTVRFVRRPYVPVLSWRYISPPTGRSTHLPVFAYVFPRKPGLSGREHSNSQEF